MLKASLLFYIFAVVAILLGFAGVPEMSVDLGKTLLGISIGLVAVNFVTGLASGKTPDYL